MTAKQRDQESKYLAIAGICGAVIYAIADLFLYMGTDIFDDTSLWNVPEWRLMTSMRIGVIGSLLMILGFISLYRLYDEVFGRIGKLLITPSFLCVGGILYMHFTLGVYAPLTFQSARKAGVTEVAATALIQNANRYLNPLTIVLVVLGYLTELVLIYGILSGRFGLKKRTLFYMYGGYALLFGLFLLIGYLSGEWGLTGSLESLFEITFSVPALLFWNKKVGIYGGQRDANDDGTFNTQIAP